MTAGGQASSGGAGTRWFAIVLMGLSIWALLAHGLETLGGPRPGFSPRPGESFLAPLGVAGSIAYGLAIANLLRRRRAMTPWLIALALNTAFGAIQVWEPIARGHDGVLFYLIVVSTMLMNLVPGLIIRDHDRRLASAAFKER